MTTKSLEERIRDIEDRLEILNLVASHPPGADTGSDDFVRTCWTEDGVMDLGNYASKGREEIAAVVKRPEHHAAIAGGICHFAGLPHIQLNGDTAVVTSYLQILVPQTQGDPVSVPNHGTGKGFRPFRVGANRWDLVRTKEGWKIKHRVSRPLDGSEPARKILRQALEDVMAKAKAG
jgi:SnoaL-like domain